MGEQFKAASDFLYKKGASNGELALLNRLFVEAKSSMELQKINLEAPGYPIKQIIIENLNYLFPTELVNIHKKIETYKFNNLKKQMKNPPKTRISNYQKRSNKFIF